MTIAIELLAARKTNDYIDIEAQCKATRKEVEQKGFYQQTVYYFEDHSFLQIVDRMGDIVDVSAGFSPEK